MDVNVVLLYSTLLMLCSSQMNNLVQSSLLLVERGCLASKAKLVRVWQRLDEHNPHLAVIKNMRAGHMTD